MRRPDYFQIELTDDEFVRFRDILEVETGIVLKPSKRQLLKNRLRPLLVASGKRRFLDLLDGLEDATERFIILTSVIDAVTTNLTRFFREEHQLEVLAERVLPEVVERLEADPTARVSIWSAGCSTGQEVYSIGMVIREVVHRRLQPRFRIQATDIDSTALAKARRGVYQADELEGLSASRRAQHLRDLGDGSFEVSERLKELVRFSPRNLIDPETWGPGGYSAIFCRNVLIYFSAERRKGILEQLLKNLRIGGYLFLGHAEGIHGRSRDCEFIGPSTYRRTL